MKLSEPTTSITDFLLAAELLLFSYLTLRTGTDQISILLWRMALALLGLSTLAGGLYHGVSQNLYLWRMTAICNHCHTRVHDCSRNFSTTIGFIRTTLFVLAELPLVILILRFIRQDYIGICFFAQALGHEKIVTYPTDRIQLYPCFLPYGKI